MKIIHFWRQLKKLNLRKMSWILCSQIFSRFYFQILTTTCVSCWASFAETEVESKQTPRDEVNYTSHTRRQPGGLWLWRPKPSSTCQQRPHTSKLHDVSYNSCWKWPAWDGKTCTLCSLSFLVISHHHSGTFSLPSRAIIPTAASWNIH